MLACGPRALLSHYSAAWLWGLSKVNPAPYHVCTPVHRKPRAPIVLHHARSLTQEDHRLENVIDLREVESVLARNVGHRGATSLRRAIAIYRPSPFTRSDLETEFFERCVAAGLPQPRMNFVAAGFELDAYWPECRFAVELDVFETHGTRESFEADRIRQEDLLLAGIATTRVTGHRLAREPDRVIERVARLLAQRQGAGAALQ